jgi:hypothetical protein
MGVIFKHFFQSFFKVSKGSPGLVPLLGATICTYKCESIVENPLEMLINCGGNQLHTGTGPVKTRYHLAEW